MLRAKVGIQILLPDGDPNGIKFIELSGWKGKALIVPRGKLKDIKDREESGHPAIYFLFGEGEEPSRRRVYIGESEAFYGRLLNHDGGKEFWNTAVVFTGGLNRAHVKFLENKSISLAKRINRYEIQNQVEPLENRLSDFEKVEVEDFFEKLQLVLDMFGFALFQEVPTKQNLSETYSFQRDGAEATGTLLDTGEFIVFKGSTARIREVKGFADSSRSVLRNNLEQEGVLERQTDYLVFLKDYIFTSPSAAADTVAGGSVNGWTAWKDREGKTLDENKRKQ